jgi:hypothetical protein
MLIAALTGCAHPGGPKATACPVNPATADGSGADRNRTDGGTVAGEFAWVVGSCAASLRADLPSGTPLFVVIISNPQTIVRVHISGRGPSPESCPALAEGRFEVNARGDASFYTLSGGLDATQVGIALVGPHESPSLQRGIAHVDLEHDGHSQVFTACASSEGIHFAVWNDRPYAGEPRWTGYYYVGADQEPNCPDAAP